MILFKSYFFNYLLNIFKIILNVSDMWLKINILYNFDIEKFLF